MANEQGSHKLALLKKQARKVRQKIARWERYQSEGKLSAKITNKCKSKSRYRNWDTSGLKKHLDMLERLI